MFELLPKTNARVEYLYCCDQLGIAPIVNDMTMNDARLNKKISWMYDCYPELSFNLPE